MHGTFAPVQEAFSVLEFCQVHGISKSLFYKLRQEGRGPKTIKLGRRTLITRQAATEWRTSLEAWEH
jgi:predicted DNA-binding transcriptional regulator AlpA